VGTSEGGPIFILASGQRCGSTLLQRLLNSHPALLVWGEQNGVLNGLQAEHDRLLSWSSITQRQRDSYRETGYDNWTANMAPPQEAVQAAARAYVETLFAEPARRLGKARWGFKEVRYGVDVAQLLVSLFPEARIVHLTRCIVDCFISLKHWENEPLMGWGREQTLEALDHWQRVNAEFLSLNFSPSWYLRLRYEDLLGDRERVLDELCRFLALDPAALDLGVFAKRIHIGGPLAEQPRPHISPSDLDAEERELLTRPAFVVLSEALGYSIGFEAR
jgi:hypothetical protein